MTTYSFKTTKNWRIDAEGRNPKQAYKKALQQWENDQLTSERGIWGYEAFIGKLDGQYLKYDKDGIDSIYGWQYLNIA